MTTHPYGDPRRWDEAVVSALTGYGWTGTHATEHTIVVPLDDHPRGLPEPAARGEHLYAVGAAPGPNGPGGTAHPNAPAGGRLTPLLAPLDDPQTITAQIIRVLRTGRTLP
ncbi:hypothetical protein OG963_14875 [Streptomyces sp. NBC_01707]|uniref:hypothetical protein n=1 Tax=Streptomyces sp. NBC_01707 TaxID=2975914 RepID=UPI00352DE39E